MLPWHLEASHIIGGEIHYRCMGNDNYEISLDVFRDCHFGQAEFDNPAHLAIFFKTGALFTILNLAPLSIEQLSADVNDPCLFVPPDVCVERARYRVVIALPFTPGGYNIVYQRCCRNQTITNILNPTETGATYTLQLSPKALLECNSSPVFETFPQVFICVNKPISFLHNAFDVDGDSLVYKLCTPLAGASFGIPQPATPDPPPYDSVVWTPGFGLDNILGSDPPLRIDSHTGLLTGFPHVQGQFVVGVCVEEYRDGELLSAVRRDFQYNVGLCGEILAKFEAPPAQCDDLSVQFQNQSTLSSNYQWYFNWPDLSLSSTEVNPVFTFPDTGRYVVALIAEPNSQCVDTLLKEIFLQFNSLTPDFQSSVFDCSANSVLALEDLSVDTISPPSVWNWSVFYGNDSLTSTEQNPFFVVPNPSSGTIRLSVRSVNGCEQIIEQSYSTDGINPADAIADQTICQGQSVGLNPNNGAEGFAFQWAAPVPAAEQNAVNPIVSPRATTTFSVLISAPNNLCQTTKEVTIEVLPLPELNFETDVDCDAVTVNFTNQSINAPSFIWDFGDGTSSTEVNPTHSYASLGTYTVALLVGTEALCRDTLVREITLVEKALEADFAFNYTDCSEDQITIQFSDISLNSLQNTAQWEWIFSGAGSSTEPNPLLTISNPQTLNVQLTITTEEGCVSTISKDLDIQFIEFNFTDSVLTCWNEPVELNPNGNPAYTYLWTPATGLDDPTKPNPIAQPSQTTIYTVSITSIAADTCQLVKQVMVFVPPRIDLQASDALTTCDADVNLTASSSVPVDFTWFDANGVSVATGNTLPVAVSGIQTFTVEATDGFNCQEQATTVLSGGPVNISTAGDQIICSDESLNVALINNDPNDILSLEWTPANAFLNDPTDNPTPQVVLEPGARTLTVQATNQFGCTATDSVFVAIVDSNVHLDFEHQTQCNGATVDFINTSTSGFNFVWNFGDPTTTNDVSTLDNPSYTFPGVGTYTVSLTIGFNVSCVDTLFKQVEIVEPDFIPDFTFEYLNCSTDSILIQFHDASINFLNNTSVWHWEFSNGETSDLPNPVVTFRQGTELVAQLTIVTPNGCSGSIEKTLKINFIQVDLPDLITLCPGDTIPLNPQGNTSFTYEWSPSNGLNDPSLANPIAFPAETTEYSVTITNIDEDTCSLSRTITVFVPEEIALEATVDTFTCGAPSILQASSNAPVQFSWFDGQGVLVGTDSVLEVNPEGEETFSVEASDEFGCQETDFISVTNRQIDINIAGGNIQATCPRDFLQICVINLDATDNLEYQWTVFSGSGQILSGSDTQCPNVSTETGTTVYQVEVTNQFGCSVTEEVEVLTYAFEASIFDTIQICPNLPTPINPGGNSSLTYKWSPSTGLNDPDVPNPVAELSQNTTYTVTITGFNGPDTCSAIKEVVVLVNPIIGLQTTPTDTVLCEQTDLSLAAFTDADVNYTWSLNPDFSNPFGTASEVNVSPVGTNDYFLLTVDDLGCRDSAQISVNSFPLDFDLAESVNFCKENGSVSIAVQNNASDQNLSYVWSPLDFIIGGNNSSSIEVNPTQNTVYSVSITNQFGCTALDSSRVLFFDLVPALDITVEGKDTLLFGANESTQLVATFDPSYTYNWEPAISLDDATVNDPFASPDETTLYSLTVSNEAGCTATDTVTIFVENPDCSEPFLFIPMAFTPNDDGNNDVLFVRGKSIESLNFVIYNRWGQKVFETNDKNDGWNGSFKGKRLPPDVYGYFIRATCFNGQKFFKKGNVTLLR